VRITRLVIAVAAFTLAATSLAAQQQRRVSGRVTASGSNEPLAAATVLVTGTPIGTRTNDDGRFELLVPDADVQIVARRIGFKQLAVRVPRVQSEVNVSLERDVLMLEEQVITGENTSVSRRNAANDVAVVSSVELTRAPTPTIENALAGKVAGASVSQNSGAPGGGLQVQLRGVTTINAATDPLYIVDGVIVSNDAIASGANAITAAAAGGNASNQDNPVNRIADMNPADIERIEVLKGASASAIYGSKASNGVIIITTKRGTAGAPRFNVVQRVGTYQVSNEIGSRKWDLPGVYDYFCPNTAADTARYRSLFGTGATTDYEKYLFGRTDPSYETNASVSGGTDVTRYFVSGLLKRDAGIMRGTGYDKQSIRANLSQNFGKRLTLDVNTNFVHSNAQRGLSNNDNSGTSYYMVLPFTPSFVNLKPVNGEYPANPFERSNPVQTRDLLENKENVYRFIGSANARYSVFTRDRQSLTLALNGGIDQFSQRNDIFSPNELLFEPQDGLPGTTVRGATGNVNSNINVSLVHQFSPAGAWFSATTSAGVQRERRDLDGASILTRGLIPGQTAVNQGSKIEVAPVRQLVKDLAYYAQEELLALDERLLLTAAVRADRSTNNGDIDKLYFFPKASASYRLPLLVPALDEAKLRVAFGQSGNPAIYGAKFTSLETTVYDAETGVQIGLVAGDPNIRPERQTEVEAGVDLQLFEGRSSLGVTGYQKSIHDLILQRQLAPTSGFNSQFFNGAQLRNRGVEITAAVTPISTGDATWISRATFSRNVSVITKLPVPMFSTGGFGESLGAFRIEEGKSATQIIGRTLNSDGTKSVVQLGDAAPDFQMAFANEFNWSAFRLYGLVDWKKGGDIINLTEFLYDAAGNSKDYSTNPNTGGQLRFNRWASGYTKEYVQDGSYVKVREISLSYRLPGDMMRYLGGRARSARIELSGRNLFTSTPYRGLDPEVSNFGNQAIARNIDVAPYPPSRSYFLSIDVEF
jgi:TonB-linked SusC/RagA family outer membrane protein